MGFILWLVMGALVGWIASKIMGTDAEQGTFLNILVGIVGAALGGFLLAPRLVGGTINQYNFSLGSLVISLIGAVVLLAIVNLLRGRGLRQGRG